MTDPRDRIADPMPDEPENPQEPHFLLGRRPDNPMIFRVLADPDLGWIDCTSCANYASIIGTIEYRIAKHFEIAPGRFGFIVVDAEDEPQHECFLGSDEAEDPRAA